MIVKVRVAIITFSDFNTNYGSMLQALSLKLQLEKLGHDVQFIKYREFNKPIKSGNIKENVISFVRRNALNIIININKNRIKETESNFENFRSNYLKHTKLYTSNDSLKNNLEEFDCYICGSDQIWNIECLGGLRKPYFLDFAPKNKIRVAYAPSLGNFKVLDNELKKDIKDLLNNLDWISVREKENVKDIQQLTEKPVVPVVDPAFLTAKQEWEELLPKINIDHPYGVCYFVTRSKLGEKLVSKLKGKYKIPIYNLSDNLFRISGTSNNYVTVGPLEFLTLIKNAKFVVGTSFHLAVFSIIFNVPFLIAGNESNRNRLINLLEFVDSKGRFVTKNSDIDLAIENMSKNYSISANLINEIEKSREYLINALKNADI